MIDAEFESIIRKMADEMGKTIFAESKFKALIKDYTKNEFKKEKDLLLDVIDAGCVKYINEAKNLAECKQALMKRLEDDYSLSTSKSAEMLDMLILILREEEVDTTMDVKPPRKEIARTEIQEEKLNLGRTDQDGSEQTPEPKNTERNKLSIIEEAVAVVQSMQLMHKNNIPPAIGNIISFGNYKWRVLDVQGGEALIITEDVIEKRPYNEKYSDVTWETCELRKYLNKKFLRKFTKEQQGQIIEKRIPNPRNLWYGTKGGNNTSDKIFLLSLEEADKYFGDSGDYLNERRKKYDNGTWIVVSYGHGFSNSHDSDRIVNYGSEACCWWLRSPGNCSNYATIVYAGGHVDVDGYGVTYASGGVRPALWLKV